MQRGKHKLQRTNYKSPVIAIMLSKKTNVKAITKTSNSRIRKKRFGIFTKKGQEYEY